MQLIARRMIVVLVLFVPITARAQTFDFDTQPLERIEDIEATEDVQAKVDPGFVPQAFTPLRDLRRTYDLRVGTAADADGRVGTFVYGTFKLEPFGGRRSFALIPDLTLRADNLAEAEMGTRSLRVDTSVAAWSRPESFNKRVSGSLVGAFGHTRQNDAGSSTFSGGARLGVHGCLAPLCREKLDDQQLRVGATASTTDGDKAYKFDAVLSLNWGYAVVLVGDRRAAKRIGIAPVFTAKNAAEVWTREVGVDATFDITLAVRLSAQARVSLDSRPLLFGLLASYHAY